MSKVETSHRNDSIKKVAILFAGGPAPAANAVISTAAASFVRHGIEVVGMMHGYSSLIDFDPAKPLEAGVDYKVLDSKFLKRTRNLQGIMIGTARTNPGKYVTSPEHFQDEEKVAPLRRAYEGLRSLGVDALISIGGDDTLKTANKMKRFQDSLPEGSHKIPVVHLPKTIDNDYMGIDFTFGYFTAVEFLGTELRNLIFDAEASGAYFLCECMGRSAGWLAYGAAISGEASLVMSVEDIAGDLEDKEEFTNSATGETTTRRIMNMEKVVGRMVKAMKTRDKDGKGFGVIVIAEGLAELLPIKYLEGINRDDHGHIAISEVNLGQLFARLVGKAYQADTGQKRKITGLQLGYESRCAKPHAFDVMLGSQLGVGAYRALVEEGLNGVMVSVSGQLDLHYVDFDKLINPETLVTTVRYIQPKCDFHRLARFLETFINE
ncbi:MAG: 6-phosphofructokinase [Planctomycetales bacterium]|nr:6-phosphofructokinase [Planctomycetales bacterium]